MASQILSAFNDHFMEFVEDVIRVFPEEVELLTIKNSFIAIRKANPKLVIKIWTTYVVGKYKSEIETGNLDFFINKDYNEDLKQTENSSKIIEYIDKLREKIQMMGDDNREKVIQYIQNLTKLSSMYENM
jgi:hypothetical protein